MAITKEQIFEAADQIVADGQRPTLEAVRQISGGSYTTISPALNEWKAKQASDSANLKEPTPQAVTDQLTHFGANVWATALELANARLATEREALDRARAELEADRKEATELADKLATEVDLLKERLEASEKVAKEADQKIEELRIQKAEIESTWSASQQRVDELRESLDEERRDASEAREKAARLSGQLEAYQAQNADLLARLGQVG